MINPVKKYIGLLLSLLFAAPIGHTAELTEDNFLITHKTSIFPRNGIMIPGLSFKHMNKIVDIEEAPNLRLTLHWYGMAMHEPHEKNKSKEKYLLIENTNTCLERLCAGYHEDFMMVGPYKLSTSSLAIVPQTEIETLQSLNPYFPGQWKSYDSQAETLEEASGRIIKELGRPTVRIIHEKVAVKLNNSQLIQLYQLISQDPSLRERLQKRSDGHYLVEEVQPHQLRISVDGHIINAKEYYATALPKDFAWVPHEDTVFNGLEVYGSRLFAPLLYLQDFSSEKFEIKTKKDFVEIAKGFTQAYQEVVKEIAKLNLQSSSYEVMLKDYLDGWKANTVKWYKLAQQQGQELEKMPYEETLFGNAERLKKAIEETKKTLIKFDTQKYSH